MTPDTLARFRADPAMVRVTVRKVRNGWRAWCSSRITGYEISDFSPAKTPEQAIDVVLKAADGLIEGIDLGMEDAYEHPFGAAGVEARR